VGVASACRDRVKEESNVNDDFCGFVHSKSMGDSAERIYVAKGQLVEQGMLEQRYISSHHVGRSNSECFVAVICIQ
jgi:hypothetical protein